MGNTSSQVQDEAPDASQLSVAQDPSQNKTGDDAAASSQLASEVQAAAFPAPEKGDKEKKSKKSKKRKSRETPSEAHADGKEARASQPDGGAPGAGDTVVTDEREHNGANQNAVTEPEEQQPRESRRKRKDKTAAQISNPANASATTNDLVESAHTEAAGGDKATNKKRKRKSQDAAPPATTDKAQPATTAQVESAPAEGGQSVEDPSRRKQKKSTRSAAAPPPLAQVKNTPIPFPTFNPPVTKEHESIPIRKSKRKADAAGAAKSNKADKAPAPAVPIKDERANNTDSQVPKTSDKKQKRSKKAQQDTGVTGAHEFAPQPSMNSLELSVIDPALLPPAQQQQQQPASASASKAAEETTQRKKSKKSKKSQAETVTPATQWDAVAETDADPQASGAANGITGNAQGPELTGERAYMDHQKKKQKRKRQAEDGATTPAAGQADTAEPKSKKRKNAARKDASSNGEAVASSSKGSKPQGTEDFPSSGPYTKKEVETLTRAIETYREYNDLTQYQVNDIVQAGVFNEVHGKSCKEFWDEICPCLPNRWSRETIIKFVRRKWHNFDKRGKWDPEEDQMLREAYARTPGQWTKIGEAVGRFADDCRDRWRNYLSCSETMASKRWHDSEVNELLNVVQDCLNTLLERLPEDKKNYWREELQSTERRDIWRPDEIRNLVRKMPDCMDALRAAFEEKHPRESKQKRATEKRRGSSATDGSVVINWDLVSEKMGKKRSRLQIMSKWKALEHSYSQDPKETFFTEANHWRVENGQKWAEQMLPGDKYNIVRAMIDLGLTNEERIIWNSVAHHELVKLKWAHQAKMTFLSMKELVPEHHESLPRLLQALKEHFEVHHGDSLDSHWRYEGRPGRASLKSVVYSPGPLDWRGHMRGESSYKSSARVSEDDEE